MLDPQKDRAATLDITFPLDESNGTRVMRFGKGKWVEHLEHKSIHVAER